MRLLIQLRSLWQGLLLSVAFVPALWSPYVAANLSGALMSTFASAPIEIVQTVPPVVMLTMSRDEQYFYRAYNDFTDLRGDGHVELTYDNTFEYYGYFHQHHCYRYDDAAGSFTALDTSGNMQFARFPGGANQQTDTTRHYCDQSTNPWSGNFLNWATMARLDIVRKILYGGYRSTDTATATVLERVHIPTEGHSFVKYYDGADLAKLTAYGRAGDGVITDANGGNHNGIDDTNEGISICNTSFKTAGSSQGTTTSTPSVLPDPPPMMRVVKKNFSLWTSQEVLQCRFLDENNQGSNGNIPAQSGINASTSQPGAADSLKTPGGARNHTVRIKTCESGYDPNDNLENCVLYGNNAKPEGLLQRYGLSGQIQFGLITGSYAKNISGGVLRKKVGPMSDEVSTTDGTFIAKTGTQPGIIRTLNALRMYGYDYASGNYAGGKSGDNCPNQGPTNFAEGNCRSWGNPTSEIYLEALRYFTLTGASRAPTTAFNADDTSSINGLVQDSWTTDPLGNNNECASVNAIVFSASIDSFDDDQSNGLSGTFGDVHALTKSVGDGEGITGNNFFIGKSGSQNDFTCTAKTISSLGDSFGLCPEAPLFRGSYHIAGLSWYAHTHDIRPDLNGTQQVRTFGVNLATSTPVVDIPIGPIGSPQHVRVLPAYRLLTGGNNLNPALNTPANDGAGALIDYRIVTPHTEIASATNHTPQTGTGFFFGKIWVNWNDTTAGGDYDQDVWGTIEYVVNTNVQPATVTVTSTPVSAIAGGAPMLFGYIISGTHGSISPTGVADIRNTDGFHAYGGHHGGNVAGQGANFVDPEGVRGYKPGVPADPGVLGCVSCLSPPTAVPAGSQTGPRQVTYIVSDTGAAGLLEPPLYYAAKWGGFDDQNGDGVPAVGGVQQTSEFDTRNVHGDVVAGGDGIPDNYFLVTNPSALEEAISTIFNTILERVSSGTSAAVVANNQFGDGALFQAVYDPSKKDTTPDRNEAKWIGAVTALWVDAAGFIREDQGTRGQLDNYQIDRVVDLFYDTTLRRARIRRHNSSDPNTFIDSGTSVDELVNLGTIWNARDTLSNLNDGTIQTQRAFNTQAENGRYIITWIDANTDNVPNSGEIVDFVSTNINNSNFRWLDTTTIGEAQALVDWTRGKQAGLPQFRSRLLDYNGTNTPKPMRLGDIVHSTPVSVSHPSEAFDLVEGDLSYTPFRQQYNNRRQVIYVGGNDGMIHAFNAGFFDSTTPLKSFKLSANGEVQHALGTELWAYIPKNLLPHLQWSARKDYSHVYYVDNGIRIFEVKSFTPDTDHPNGWGTLLVATMALGGGSDATGITVDSQGDGLGAANTDGSPRDDVKTKSAVVLMDVTNPEKPPVVLAELTPPNLQFTTSKPQVVPVSTVNNGTPNKWFLVLGSGPTDLSSVSYVSGVAPNQQFASLFVYDLANLKNGLDDVAVTALNGLARTPIPLTTPNVFIGDLTAADFNFNLRADALYFGTVGASSDNNAINQGSLFRLSVGESIDPNVWKGPFQLVANLNEPFADPPSLAFDARQQRWLLAASGRYFSSNDRTTQRVQKLIGIIDKNPDGTGGAPANPLSPQLDLNNLIDVSNAHVFSDGSVTNVGTSTTFKGLANSIVTAGGWQRNFVTTIGQPSERGVSGVSIAAGVAFVPGFTPGAQPCTSEGTSILYGLSFLTGTAIPEGIFGQIPCAGCPQGKTESPPIPYKQNNAGGTISYTPDRQTGQMQGAGIFGNAGGSTPGTPGTGSHGQVCTNNSTAAISCESANLVNSTRNGEISWRQLLQ